MSCSRCGNERCFGYVLLHRTECNGKNIERIKANAIEDHGEDIEFEMIESPSSGEVFNKFYELHMSKINS